MHRGYVKIWRKIEDSGLLGNADVCQMFMYLMVKVTHKARKILVGSRVVELQAGQFFTSRSQLVRALNSTEKRVRMALNALQSMEILGQQTAKDGTVISLLNWDAYQQLTPATGPTEGQERAKVGPSEGQRIYIKQECKNERKEEKNTQKEKPLKRPYGEFKNVMLTDVERDKLVETYGKAITLRGIELLGGYIESTGKRYKSHYACFRTWVAEKAKEELCKARLPSGTRGMRGGRTMTVSQQRALERDQQAREMLGEIDGDDGDTSFAIPEGLQFALPTSAEVRGGTQDFGHRLDKRPIGLQ